jgi:putative nucleotidyltransferase with HDIG domain
MGMNVLFVDDESNVLSGLRRLLRGQRSEWEMEFASSGAEALGLMEKRPIDVIVSDMRMPQMNGAELLARVAKDYPKTVRLILSGQSENEKILRSIGPAHQFLSKPCDPDVLIGTIHRACGLQTQLQHPTLRQLVGKTSFLPSLPALYQSLVHELESDSSSMDQIGDMISSDIAMSAKVLQLINSSFFGLAQHVSCPKHTVALLGLNVIRPLVLLAGAFSQCDNPDLDGYSLEKSIQHSLSVATLARKIAASQSTNSQLIDDAFIAGMMHDIGKLILAVNLRERYQEILFRARDAKVSTWQLEIEMLGTSHAEIGAYLLTLWGFPNSIVEAVAWHHQPSLMPLPIFSPLSAVHLANALMQPSGNVVQEAKWDRAYLKQLNSNEAHWSELAEQFSNLEKTH